MTSPPTDRASTPQPRADRVDAEPLIVRCIAREVARRHGNAAALCRGLGFTPADLERIDFRVSYAQTGRVIQRAVHMLGEPHLGLRLGASFSLVSWGLCLVGMMASAGLHEALALALDFMPSTERFLRLRRHEENGHLAAVAEPVYEKDDEVARFLVEHSFAALARACRFVVGPWHAPQRVELSTAAPLDPRGHERVFGCPVRFGCAADRLVFDRVDHPIATADALVARQCRHQLEQRAGAAAPSDLEAVIVRALRADLHSPPGMAAIAASINISERTLRRRLLDADLSYAGMLDQERMRRALALLSASNAPMARVAEQAGFSDARSLRRAIKRWTGRTPSALRRDEA